MHDIVKSEMYDEQWYFISSVYTIDQGYETMIFHCRVDTDGYEIIDYSSDLYTEHYKSEEEMNAHHVELVKKAPYCHLLIDDVYGDYLDI